MKLPNTTEIGHVAMFGTMPGLDIALESNGTVRIQQSNTELLLDVEQCLSLAQMLVLASKLRVEE